MRKLTNEEFNLLNEKVLAKDKHIRSGQAYMNALYEIKPDLYNQITEEGLIDPFYNDDKIIDFLNFITK